MTSSRRKPARHKIMDLLARRDHSELELRRKLGDSEYTDLEIEDAIEFAKENRWLAPPDELAQRVALSLDHKRKGHRYIERFLRSKGLPAVAKNGENEVLKGRAVVCAKLGAKLRLALANHGRIDYEDRKKVHRLLVNRGFDDETIHRVIDSLKDLA